jgi:hypothetical protein
MGLDIFIFYVDLGYQLGLTPVYVQVERPKAIKQMLFTASIGKQIRLSF